MPKVSGNDLVVQTLKNEGVDTVFYLTGGPMSASRWAGSRPPGRAEQAMCDRVVLGLATLTCRLCRRVGGAAAAPFRPGMGPRGRPARRRALGPGGPAPPPGA
jgi:hypothetical protein